MAGITLFLSLCFQDPEQFASHNKCSIKFLPNKQKLALINKKYIGRTVKMNELVLLVPQMNL